MHWKGDTLEKETLNVLHMKTPRGLEMTADTVQMWYHNDGRSSSWQPRICTIGSANLRSNSSAGRARVVAVSWSNG